MSKENLINYILTNGKQSKTWLELAKEFEIGEGLTNEQRSKKANDIWRIYERNQEKQLSDFERGAKVKSIKTWQNPEGKWLKSIAYENTRGLDLNQAKKDLVKAIAEYELPKFKKIHTNYSKTCAVLNLYDAHISSLALVSDTGHNSDTESSIIKFEKCFDELLTTTAAFSPEVIVFPVGHDFIHENSIYNTTKKGTKLDVSGNHFDNFTKGLMLIRKCIDKASQVAKVYVPLVSGNHDSDVTNYLMTALEQIFEGNHNVEIDARRITRKYFRFGSTLLGLTHGDGVKAEALPLIMAVERSKDFADTTERLWLTGHVHHLSCKEFPGVTVRTLRGLADTDKWHFDSGYVGAKKAGSVMIFQEEEGLKAEFSVNIK